MLTTPAGPDCTPRHITTTRADIARMTADLGGQAVERDGALVYTLAGVAVRRADGWCGMRTTVALGVGRTAITAEHLPFCEDIGVYIDDDTAGALSLLMGPEQAQQLADALARLGIRADPEPMGGAA